MYSIRARKTKKLDKAYIGANRFEVKADVDSGAELVLIGSEQYQKYKRSGGRKTSTKLKVPIRIRVANEKTEVASHKLVEDLELQLETGSVHVRNVTFYIVDGDWGDLLVGWPVLEALEATPEDALRKLGGTEVDMLNWTPETTRANVWKAIVAYKTRKISRKGATKLLRIFQARYEPEEPVTPDEIVFDGKTVNIEPNVSDLDASDPFEEPGIGESPDDEEDFETALKHELEQANRSGCKDLGRLERILRKWKGIFATKFEECEISKLSPMEPELRPNVEPCICKPRRMSLEQMQWLQTHLEMLENKGMIKRVRNPKWGTPVFVVSKKGGSFRMVADFRGVNQRALTSTLPMPLLEQLIECVTGAEYFGTLDNMKGFNLLRVTFPALFTLVTPFACYEMNVAPQGFKNSPVVYQDRIVNDVLKFLHGKTCVNWIDDLLIFGQTEAEYLDRLDQVLERYDQFQVKLSLSKCQFFRDKVVWCGREFSKGGYTYAPEYYEKVLKTPEPVMASELADFLYAITWIQTSLPVRHLRPKTILQDLISTAFEKQFTKRAREGKQVTKSRKKRLLVGVKLSDVGWTKEHSEAFKELLEAIHSAIRTAVPDKTKQLCLFKDASEVGCAIVVTQCDPLELHKPVHDQQHQIVFMTTHRWTENELNWHISCKEAYPLIFAFTRLNYLFAGRHVKVFTDHRNLKYIMNPSAITPKTTLMRLQRWALIIQNQDYAIEHVEGEQNITADLFSRWGLAQIRTAARAKTRLQRAREQQSEEDLPEIFDLLSPARVETSVERKDEFEFVSSRVNPIEHLQGQTIEPPTVAAVVRAQRKSGPERPSNAIVDKNGLFRVDGKIWLPTSTLVRVVAVAHCYYGHPGANALAKAIGKKYYSHRIQACCQAFNKRCINCLGAHSPHLIRRRWGQTYHGKACNDVLHMDFLYITKHGNYLLVIRDDFSGKVELVECEHADGLSAADAILWWRARYGLNADTTIVTDGGSHFANQLVDNIVARLRVRHHITVAYSPWSNGKAERVNREVLKLYRVLLAELGWDIKDWRLLTPVVQSALNNIPRARLGHRSSDHVFLGREAVTPLDIVRNRDLKPTDVTSVDMTNEVLREQLARTDASLKTIHEDVLKIQDKIRAEQAKKESDLVRRLGVNDIQYARGDYVLISRQHTRGEKLALTWIGPFQIVDVVNPWVYKVKSLLNDKTKEVHVRRIRFYEDKFLEITEAIREQFIHDFKGFEVDNVLNIRWDAQAREYKVKVKWWGFTDKEATWLGWSEAINEIPDKIDEYLQQADDTATNQKLLRLRETRSGRP